MPTSSTTRIEEALRARPEGAGRGTAEGGARGRVRRPQGLGRRARDEPSAEIRVGGDHEFYDFEAKYLARPGHRDRHPGRPAGPSRERAARARGARLRGRRCEGLARVDFFVMPDGSLVINEINTMQQGTQN